ncbi:hypothetical protein BPAE_0356g00010 [Botrytis paeoniae]|uniref:Uncharacterized protein n=1 Tax=Botrytis paeoniae TaxID=278948 RepID=A0A4Z1F5M2_9HELO|nr:hypothetical protein BPAE_0356g00010 [Botrytis paeoniae]
MVYLGIKLCTCSYIVNKSTELLSSWRKRMKSKEPTFQGNSSSDGLENEMSRQATTVAPDQHETTKSAPRKWSRRVLGGKRGNEEAPIM